MEQCVLQILVGCQAVNKSALDATQRFHHCIHISPPLLLIPSQMNPVHVLYPPSLRSILIFSQLCLGHPSSHLPSRFSQIHAICPTHIILDLIIYVEE